MFTTIAWHANLAACMQVSFLDAASTPREVSFAQTGSLRKAWEELGGMPLRRDDRQQLQHVFRLGPQHSIKRYLRISFSGHLLGQTSGRLSAHGTLNTEYALGCWQMPIACVQHLGMCSNAMTSDANTRYARMMEAVT